MTAVGSTNVVLNVHHFGSVDNLPAGAKYIGRPSPYGNPYSSKSGKYTREECVALHRIDLYRRLTDNPLLLHELERDLKGHDVACWCVHSKKTKACHGFTLLHILSDKNLSRDYAKSVVFYLMEDLRSAMTALTDWVHHQLDQDHYLQLYIHLGDVRLLIERALLDIRTKEVRGESLHFFLGLLVTDLELAIRDPDLRMVGYYFDHIIWNIYRFTSDNPDLYHEPVRP